MWILEKYSWYWKDLLVYNDIEMNSRRFSAILFLVCINAGLVASIYFANDFWSTVAAFAGTFLTVHALAYSYLLMGANSRAAKVEDALPDFLALVASNIHSGLTPDKALIVSAREEFGPLSVEVNRAGRYTLTGMPLERVFIGMTEHIHSDLLDKTMRLIVEGLHSGGDMVELLEKNALDIRKFRSVRRETSSMILNYVLFIMAAITFGGPLLYGVASFLVDIMLKIKQKLTIGVDSSLAGQMGVFKGQLMLTPEGVAMFSSAAIVITVFFGCMAVGIMQTGRRMDGLKYFPLLTVIGLGILFFVRAALTFVLGGMMGGM
ncbi:MAG: type II secretion system F family protein [Candidatus Micrarchaeia archaeon]|jgi:archaellum biogenesis protein FlaJ (TadC family)